MFLCITSSYRFTGLVTEGSFWKPNYCVPKQADFFFTFPSGLFERLSAQLTSPMACWSVLEAHPDVDAA